MQYHLIMAHRHLTLKDVCFHTMQYVGNPTHMVQDAVMMFTFLCELLINYACSQVTLEIKKYMINGTADQLWLEREPSHHQ